MIDRIQNGDMITPIATTISWRLERTSNRSPLAVATDEIEWQGTVRRSQVLGAQRGKGCEHCNFRHQ